MKVFIDLFSGLGGAAAAFDADPSWTTIKIDNNPILAEHNRGLILMDTGQDSLMEAKNRRIAKLTKILKDIGWRGDD